MRISEGDIGALRGGIMAFEHLQEILESKDVVDLDDDECVAQRELESESYFDFALEIDDGIVYLIREESVIESAPYTEEDIERCSKECSTPPEYIRKFLDRAGPEPMVQIRKVDEEVEVVDLDDPSLRDRLFSVKEDEMDVLVISDSGKVKPLGVNYSVTVKPFDKSSMEGYKEADDLSTSMRRMLDDIIKDAGLDINNNPEGLPTQVKDFGFCNVDEAIEIAKAFERFGVPATIQYSSCMMGTLYFRGIKDRVGMHMPFGRLEDKRFRRFDTDTIFQLLTLLTSISPQVFGAGGHRIVKITEETSSLCVGEVNASVFKIYDNEETAAKEAFALHKLQTYEPVLYRVAYTVLGPEDDWLKDTIMASDLTDDQKAEFFASQDKGYVSYNGLYVVITESQEEPDTEMAKMNQLGKFCSDALGKPYSPMLVDDKQKKVLSRLLEEMEPGTGDDEKKIYALGNSEILHRLYTLALLHGEFTQTFTQQEKDIVGAPDYEDFLPLDVKRSVESADRTIDDNLLETYLDVSMRQRKIHKDRKEGEQSKEEPLVFTHGDAKYDNWFDGVLVDFGSCKFSTEYKDVAKALLDSAVICDQDIIGDYIDVYLFMREATGSPVAESNELFRRNVHEALLTESVRTVYYKAPMPEKKKVVDHMMKVAEKYAKIVKERGD
jgi:thiamine kinase-like enzyme